MSQEYTLNLKLSCEPQVAVRVIMPSDDALTIKSKKSKQFLNKKTCILTVYYGDKKYVIPAHKNYCFDGATIPFGIGKGDTRLFVPALFHDIMCDNKAIIDNDRHLSSLIFKELLIMCKLPKWKAQIMYASVETYQRLFGGWKK